MSKLKLMDMKEQLDQLAKDESQLIGQKKEIIQTLKDTFGVKSLKGAEKELAKLEKQSITMQEDLDKIVDTLEEDYEWND